MELSQRSLSERLHLDPLLLLGLFLLSGFGLGALYSAGGEDLELVMQQALRVAIAFGLMLGIAQIPPKWFSYFAPLPYGVGIVLLLAVLASEEVEQGVQRWLQIGPISFQPSEIAKLTVPLMVAYTLTVTGDAVPPRLWQIVCAGAVTILPTILVMQQPDLGTAFLIATSGAIVLFLAGLSWRVIGVLIVLMMAGVPALWYVMHDYQRRRVLTLLDPEQDPLGAGYHIIQSKIAIGSGGLFGKGWLNGTQSQLDFLPERTTDFIFAVISEEFGLFGVLFLFLMYFFVIARGLYIATHAQDTFGKLAVGALVFIFFTYVYVNTSMVSGILPVVGLPLPFASFGGSSVVTLMAGFGIVMSIHTHRRFLSH